MSNHQKWTEAQVPQLNGQVAIVTGANSGIGLETARVLAEKGATIIMACRNLTKSEPVAAQIRQNHPAGQVVVMELDLENLDSVRRFASEFLKRYDRLDMLINNAGVMIPPYGKTKQGFELQFGINHLGHFALTGLLLDRLLATPHSRVVNVSSGLHAVGTIDFADLNWEKRTYNPNAAYGQSKLANLLFTYELQRRLAKTGQNTISVAAHPGWTETNLQQHSGFAQFFNPLLAQRPVMGALPTLYGATASDVHGGEYYGPDGLFELRGYPTQVKSNDRSHDARVAAKLWDVSEQLTGVHYNISKNQVPLTSSL